MTKHLLPFGGGPRVCMGNRFSMMEARLIWLTVLQGYKLLLAPGQSLRDAQAFGLLRMIPLTAKLRLQ